MKSKPYIPIVTLLLSITTCQNGDVGLTSLIYTPPIYFAGYINGTYDSLTGNYNYKNNCYLVEDTIRMCFYSYNFEEVNRIRKGDFIRIDLYPGSDSVLRRGKVLFHMARYHERNTSYTITASDTLFGFDRIQFGIEMISRRKGGRLSIDGITIMSKPVVGTNGEYLEIKHGRVQGTIN